METLWAKQETTCQHHIQIKHSELGHAQYECMHLFFDLVWLILCVCFFFKEKAIATVMGVLILRVLVCGQLILFSLVVNNITNAQTISESPSKAPPLNATRNHTENNASNSSSNSVYNDSSTTQNNLNTQTTPTGINSTLGPIQGNTTVTGSAVQPNSTENTQTTQSATFTTIKINSTAVTSTDNSTHSNNETATSSTTPVTEPTAITSSTITQNATTFFNESQGRFEWTYPSINNISQIMKHMYPA